MKWLAVILLSITTGCAVQANRPIRPPDPSPQFIDLVWARSTADGVAGWHRQIVRRWPGQKFVAVFCHGGDNHLNQWCVWPDPPLVPVQVEAVAQTLHAVYPGRLIVFLGCNPQHEKVTTPNVAFAMRDIWTVPRSDIACPNGSDVDVVFTGNIFEFVMTSGEDGE